MRRDPDRDSKVLPSLRARDPLAWKHDRRQRHQGRPVRIAVPWEYSRKPSKSEGFYVLGRSALQLALQSAAPWAWGRRSPLGLCRPLAGIGWLHGKIKLTNFLDFTAASGRTMLNGWAYGAIYASSTERTAALDGWTWHYNHHRRHSAIGRQTPITKLNNLLGTYN
jgi:hypothetical protein